MVANSEFGAAVKAALAKRNLTVRDVVMRCRLQVYEVQRMANGRVPDLEAVEIFARLLGEDVNEWRVLAGYDPIPQSADVDLLDRWADYWEGQKTKCAPAYLKACEDHASSLRYAAELLREGKEPPDGR